MWDCDYFTKQMYDKPWNQPLMIDWTREFPNGSYAHYAEPRHSTQAISEEAVDVIKAHASHKTEKRLFLYVSYTAGHSPLQPLLNDQNKCKHIPHLWRQQFCGLVVGLDEGIYTVTEAAEHFLGRNTLVIVSSDNGGSPWFGGLNTPLRGSKMTPFEGGIKVRDKAPVVTIYQ